MKVYAVCSEGECYLALKNGDRALEVYMGASKQLRGSKHATVAVKHTIQVSDAQHHFRFALCSIQNVRSVLVHIVVITLFAKLIVRIVRMTSFCDVTACGVDGHEQGVPAKRRDGHGASAGAGRGA